MLKCGLSCEWRGWQSWKVKNFFSEYEPAVKNVNENHNLRIAATARLEGILNESSLCAVWLQMGSQERDEAEFHQPGGGSAAVGGHRNRSSGYGKLAKKNSSDTLFFQQLWLKSTLRLLGRWLAELAEQVPLAARDEVSKRPPNKKKSNPANAKR